MDTLTIAAKVALVAEVIVLVHLLGHLLTAKLVGIPVAFHLGLGPVVPRCQWRWGRNAYAIGVFLLGGYVSPLPQSPGNRPHILEPLQPLWRRLTFICGGMLMNVVFAWACCVLATVLGTTHIAAVIDIVDAGSPAWKKGIPSGAIMEQIGEVRGPFFDDLTKEVIKNLPGETLTLAYRLPGDQDAKSFDIEPRFSRYSGRPMLGVTPASSTRLAGDPGDGFPATTGPFVNGSAAANASPRFAWNDTIIATTDPNIPDQVTPLADDPRNPGGGSADYFEWCRRLRLLADREIDVRVHRANGEEASIRLPPQFHTTFGMRMEMGDLVALRDNSAAAKADIQLADIDKGMDGDRIEALELPEPDGEATRFDNNNLDPLRLPFQLRQWARRMARAGKADQRIVTLQIRRPRAGAVKPSTKLVHLPWDASWEFQRDLPLSLDSPLSIPELGLAYHVTSLVFGVEPGRENLIAGDDERVRPGDIIQLVQFVPAGEDDSLPAPLIVHYYQWANVFASAQRSNARAMIVHVDRGNERVRLMLKLHEDKSWPNEDRGLFLAHDSRVVRASSVADAVASGSRAFSDQAARLGDGLRQFISEALQPKNLGGPRSIAVLHRSTAADFSLLLIVLASLNLHFALLNLLPIPLLDGSEALMAIMEKLRGKPLTAPARRMAYRVGIIILAVCFALAGYLAMQT